MNDCFGVRLSRTVRRFLERCTPRESAKAIQPCVSRTARVGFEVSTHNVLPTASRPAAALPRSQSKAPSHRSLARVIGQRSVRFQLLARRRVAALFALLCIVAMPFELLMPDVHDADGVAAAQVVGAGDEGNPAPSPRSVPDDSEPLPTHSTHVDHCTHAHLAGLRTPDATTESPVARSRVPDAPSRRPLSVSVPPRKRPPIA